MSAKSTPTSLFVDLLTTSLEPDEILTSISVPALNGAGAAYEKHAHPASGYAVVGVAAVVKVEGGNFTSARIAVTGATSKATRATAAEQALVGKPANADSTPRLAAQAADGLELNGDVYASAEISRAAHQGARQAGDHAGSRLW